MSTDGASTKLFLSYSRDAATFAQAVAAALEEKGFAASTDRGFVNGEDFEERLRRELDRSEWVVVLISSEALRSPNVNFEIGAAFAQDKHVLPIYLSEAASRGASGLLRRTQGIEAHNLKPSEVADRIAGTVEATAA